MRTYPKETPAVTTLRDCVIAGLLLLAACGEPNKLTHGKVIDKDYDDADTWSSYDCISHDSEGFCIAYMWNDHYEPEHYRMRIQGVDGQEDLREWHDVPEDIYVQTRLGENWSE